MGNWVSGHSKVYSCLVAEKDSKIKQGINCLADSCFLLCDTGYGSFRM